MKNRDQNLKRELYKLISEKPEIAEFLLTDSLDGIWYWDTAQKKPYTYARRT